MNMADNVTATVGAVQWWLGNPLSQTMIRFLTRHDSCGYRLDNAFNIYLNGYNNNDYCWKCQLAGKMLEWTCHRGGSLFGLNENDIRNALSQPGFRKGLKNVLEGFAQYGVTLPQKLNAPFLVVWDITHACNLRCKHCYQNAGKPLSDELSTEEALALVDQLAEIGVVALSFSGGEPLMRKDIFDIAARAHDYDIYISCATNGTLITPEVAHRMKESGIEYVEISLDGPNPQSHDSFRGVPGAFERTLSGIRACVDEGLYTAVASTATRDTCHQIPEIYELSKELGVRRLMCFNFVPTGRGIQMIDQDLEPEQREKLLQFLLRRNGIEGEPDALSTAPQFARVAIEDCPTGMALGHFYYGKHFSSSKTKALADFIGGCGAGRLYCSIEPNGDVQPCVFMPIRLGNLREKSFLEIWHESLVLQQLQDRTSLKDHCGSCENKFICGGCRARAWAYYGDLSAPDPGCINNKDRWDELIQQQREELTLSSEPEKN